MDDWQVSSRSFVQDAFGQITVAFTLQMQCVHMHFWWITEHFGPRLLLNCTTIVPPETGVNTSVNGANVWSPVFHYYLNGLKLHFVKEHCPSLQFCREFASWLLFSCLGSCHFCLLFVFIFCFFVSLPFPSLSCLHVPHAAGFDMWQWKPSRVTLTSCWRVWAVPPSAVRMASARLPFPSLCSTGKPRRPPPSVCSHSWFLASL